MSLYSMFRQQNPQWLSARYQKRFKGNANPPEISMPESPYFLTSKYEDMFKKPAPVEEETVDLSTPTFADTAILMAQDRMRRKQKRKVNRQSTDVTGGLTGSPTLGSASLWGV